MKRILVIMLLITVLMLPCHAAAEDEGVELSTPSGESTDMQEKVDEPSGEAHGMTPEELKLFLDEKVIPYVIVAVSAVAAIYVAISPILAKIKASSNKFDAATGNLDEANKQGKVANEQSASMLEELRAEREAQRAEQVAFEGRVAAQLQSMADNVQQALGATSVQTREIRDMVKIGFCNNKDLVARGYAKQIARIARGAGLADGDDAVTEQEEKDEQVGREEADEHEQNEDKTPA